MIAILIAQLLIFIVCASINAADVIPPDGIIIINNQPLSTKSRTVDILIPASDEGSGVKEMCVSVGTSCNTWVAYSKEAHVILTGDVGNWFSICSKVRDNVGWESTQKCVQIQLVGE
jgi:hypothetical protein